MVWNNYEMNKLLENLSENVWIRIKHVKKSHDNLWELIVTTKSSESILSKF